ncbi:MAG: cytochrome P450 [Terricaulis sp.]
MSDAIALIEPPAPAVHPKDLPPLRLILGTIRNSLEIWPARAFVETFSRNKIFGIKSVLINDPAGIRHVLATNAKNYVRPPIMARIARPILGQGIFLAEGDAWRQQRRLLASAFTPQSVSKLIPHFAAAASDFLAGLSADRKTDLSDAYQGVALNAVLRALFSIPNPSDRDRVAGVVRGYINGPGRPQVFDGFAKSETDFSFALSKRRAFRQRWTARVDAIVSARLEAQSARPEDLLDLLIAARDPETGLGLQQADIRDQAATMIFAGYETTARLLFWASYLLTLDQAEQSRVYAEISAFPPAQVGALEDLNRWPRLRNVLLEALRLYPPLPLLVREPREDDVIAGERVRAGTQVYIAPWIMHRHHAYWREPTAFSPDRFADQPSPWTNGGAFLPFGAGPRICIGAAFALAEAQIVLATLLSRFRISLDDERPVLPVGQLTTQPSHAPLFTLSARAHY